MTVNYITNLNIQVPVQKLKHSQRFWNEMVVCCGVSNWMYLEKERSTSALVVNDYDLW